MELTSEQRALRESVAEALRRHPPWRSRSGSGTDRELWRLLSGIGAAGLAIPEQYGGAGASAIEVSLVNEELGKVLAPTPMLGSAVLAAQAILASDDAGACERLLPGIASGATVAALCWTGPDGGWDPARAACRATGSGDGAWALTGTAHYVLDGDVADVLIVAARRPDGSIGLFEVMPDHAGTERRRAASMDQTRRLAVVSLTAASGAQIGSGPARRALAHARDLAAIALSAEQAGAAARALELTVSYTKTRVQFGRAIASFQAIQHRLAELHVLVESARALSYAAANAASDQAGDLPVLAAAAKAYCSEAFSKVAAEMIQLHGAIGVTWEHDAHRYFKRAHGSGQLLGSPSAHLARIAKSVTSASG